AYDQVALGVVISRVSTQSTVDRRLPFNLPLAAVLPLVPLTLLPLDLAFRTWQLVSLALLLLALVALTRSYPLGRRSLALAALGCLASVPAWSVLTEAQLTPLLVLGGALVLADLRFNAASVAFGGGLLLAVKPHFLPVYMVILLAARHWRSLLAASSGAAVMLLSPLAAGGPVALDAMVRNAINTNGLVPLRLTEAWIGLLSTVLPAAAVTVVSLGLYLGVLLLLSLGAFRLRGAVIVPFAALALSIGMLASPHVLPHDLLLLLPPAWLGFWLYREERAPSPLLALILVDLALLVDLRGVGLVLGPIAMTSALAWAVWNFRRRADPPRALDKPAAA
ncbi:MAG: glycosyltransferase 87 family protein, partial [Candidatus Dormibacteraeota bacterium]|nr:glycosyltransferase 87 family protein [Candidatus Dormibacteraeota bacterium]